MRNKILILFTLMFSLFACTSNQKVIDSDLFIMQGDASSKTSYITQITKNDELAKPIKYKRGAFGSSDGVARIVDNYLYTVAQPNYTDDVVRVNLTTGKKETILSEATFDFEVIENALYHSSNLYGNNYLGKKDLTTKIETKKDYTNYFINFILNYKDNVLGNLYIVIPKIREVSKGLGSVNITFDNGDKRNIESKKPDELMKDIVEKIEEYYRLCKM